MRAKAERAAGENGQASQKLTEMQREREKTQLTLFQATPLSNSPGSACIPLASWHYASQSHAWLLSQSGVSLQLCILDFIFTMATQPCSWPWDVACVVYVHTDTCTQYTVYTVQSWPTLDELRPKQLLWKHQIYKQNSHGRQANSAVSPHLWMCNRMCPSVHKQRRTLESWNNSSSYTDNPGNALISTHSS